MSSYVTPGTTNTYVKRWLVDEEPRSVGAKLRNTRTMPNKHGHFVKDGWVSYRGRFIPFPKVYRDRDFIRKYRWEETCMKAHSEKYIAISGDIFEQRYPGLPDKIPLGPITIYVNTAEWRKMSREERWDYVRDIAFDGWKVDFEKHMEYWGPVVKKFHFRKRMAICKYYTRKNSMIEAKVTIEQIMKAQWYLIMDAFPLEFSPNPTEPYRYTYNTDHIVDYLYEHSMIDDDMLKRYPSRRWMFDSDVDTYIYSMDYDCARFDEGVSLDFEDLAEPKYYKRHFKQFL